MKKTNRISILSLVLALVLCMTCLTGCGGNAETGAGDIASGGTLCLKVNPEIAIQYDDAGLVTALEARNDDGTKILADYTGYEGKECRVVIEELVKAINEAGYFAEEIEGETRQITIEIEKGSNLPNDKFMDEIVESIRAYVNTSQLKSPVDVTGESEYGISNYVDTDYGPENDGATDYDDQDDSTSNYDDKAVETTAPAAPTTNNTTNYNDSVYDDTNTTADSTTNYDDSTTNYNNSPYAETPTTPTKPTTSATNDSPYDDTVDSTTNYDDNTTNYNVSSYDDNSDANNDSDSGYDD